MTPWWIGYAMLVGGPIAAAAWLVAGTTRRRNLDERHVWLVGLALSIMVPAGLLLWRLWAVRSGAPLAAFVLEVPGLEVVPRPDVTGPVVSATTLALAGWGIASALMGGWLLVSMATVHRIRAASRRRTVRGRGVRVSKGAGPAVVGFLRPEILLPAWVLRLDPDEAEWILRHEEEHVRARDPLLLLGAHLARVALPWNPAVWFLGARLVRAIEIDCDRRVLRAHPDPLAYGHTLVRALAREPRTIRAAAAFSLQTHDLEERITTMTRSRSRFGPLGWLSALAAVVLVAGSCGIPIPTNADDDGPLAPESPAEVVSGSVSDEPTFTPFTVAPGLANRDEIADRLAAEYPPLLRDAGIGGKATIWFLIGSDGETREVRIKESSGHEGLDEAALRVAREMRWEPARNREKPVDVWVSFPIAFQSR